MPNDWFQFKQFKIHQDRCAMKVSTDACIQGAWAAKEWSRQSTSKEIHVLDIGTGTGLLTLMLAQTMPNGYFDAIEINEEAYQQAVFNFEDSAWPEQIKAIHTPLSDFRSSSAAGKYDFIICNPPFFQNHLESQKKSRNDARHSQSLSKEELATATIQLLKEEGSFCVLFPASEWESWLKVTTKNSFYLQSCLTVFPNPGKKANRIIGIFSKKQAELPLMEELIIYDKEKQYTVKMKSLLQDYYLAF